MQGATAAEQARFLRARQHDAAAAAKMWEAHVSWRASNLPLAGKDLGQGLPPMAIMLPPEFKCKLGRRVLVVMGAMYDGELGTAQEYTLACAQLIDKSLDKDSDDKITVCVDTRGGDGWRNPKAWSVLPWVRDLASTLSANFPERLERLVLFPIPWLATAVWSAATALLDEATASKMQMISGSAGRDEPIPDGVEEFLDASVVGAITQYREASLRAAHGDALAVPVTPPSVANEAAAPSAVEVG